MLTIKTYLKKVIEIHKDRFDYSKTIFTGSRNNIIITCKEHGDFIVRPDNHYNSYGGCRECLNNIKRKENNGFIRRSYIWNEKSRKPLYKISCIYKDQLKDGKAIFYYFSFIYNNEKLYKIGVTSKDLFTRYRIHKLVRFKFINILEKEMDRKDAFKLEKSIKRIFKKYSVSFTTPFGHTEVFTKDILNEEFAT